MRDARVQATAIAPMVARGGAPPRPGHIAPEPALDAMFPARPPHGEHPLAAGHDILEPCMVVAGRTCDRVAAVAVEEVETMWTGR